MLSTTHLIDTYSLTKEDITLILDTARSFSEVNKRAIKKLPTLRGRTVINLFLESSTRTRTSFEIAGKRLSADTINISGSTSAVTKGESLADTAETLAAMDSDMIIVRSRFAGAANLIAERTNSKVINGGDGKHQHPTQALLDLYTMRERFGDIEGLKVAIVGDIVRSRVVGSLVPALKTMGAQVTLVGPATFMPARPDVYDVDVSYSLDDVLEEVDVLYLLRIQMERVEGAPIPSLREYARVYGINSERVSRMKRDAIVMHPGPMNRGVEIAHDVAESDISLILDQVNAGVSVRMAVMYLLLGGDEGGDAA